jgi:hypothetical protein
MSHDYSATTNKQQKHPKVHFQQYLYDPEEPRDDISGALPSELAAELLENNDFMRRRFRHIAQSLRSRYS